MKLNAKQLRAFKKSSKDIKLLTKKVPKNKIYIILDNVLDTYNIGSVFRLADAISAKKIYLCGQTEVPPNSRIKKASINTTEIVNWQYHDDTLGAINKLKKQVKNIQIIALEQAVGSVPYDKFEYKLPVALIVGHETQGVSRKVLKVVDGVVELPMFGINSSLNVMVSLGIVLYQVVEKTID